MKRHASRAPVAALCLLVVCLLPQLARAFATDYSLYEPARLVARPDYELGYVFIERWRGDRFLGIDRVVPLERYLDYEVNRSVGAAWLDKAKRTQEQRELAADASGLIPDIQLPKLPLFGEGSRIDISGRDRITLGGRQTFVRGTYIAPGSRGLFPELKMNQQLSVALNGTIGERTKVNLDYDVERRQSDNKVSLSYTGPEDEIVQSVELGDTRLSIPGTAYTGDLPSHKGLFGAAARGKLGGVDLYAIASREESQGQSQSFTGRRVVSVDTIYDGQYITRRFYAIPETATIRSLYVYTDDKNQANNQTSQPGIATVWPDDPDHMPDSAGWTYDRAPGAFDLKAYGQEYVLQPGNVIEFLAGLDNSTVVGLVITTDRDTIGGSFWHDSLVLALLKPERTDSSSATWDYELRNVYSLRRSEVTLGSFRLFRDSTGTVDPEYEDQGTNTGRRFTEVLAIDPDGNGLLDYPWFDSRSGLIRFPDRRPFANTGLSLRDSVIYRKDPSQLSPSEGREYYMVVQYSSATEKYYLGQPEITDNSERVIVNGEVWRRGDDYTMDYANGTIRFLRPLLPDASIQVTYEYMPLFSMTQKSLVGTRAEWNPQASTRVGTSLFFRSEGMADEKPELGSEPFRRMIAEADASYLFSSDAVTAFIDRLPLVRAQSATRFEAAAEGALSLPDPNTRGVAWLDGFEGSTVTSEVPTTASLWSWASVPVGKDTASFGHSPVFWRNAPRGQQVYVDSVFGPEIGERGNTHDYLRVVVTPDPGDPATWSGIMTAPQGGMNLKDLENLQVVMRTRLGTGRLHITAGYSIDEDAPRRNRAGRIVGYDGVENTEDRNHNGILDPDEDTGLDGVFGSDSIWTDTSADDGNDDFDEDANPMGTENNLRPTPDGEDIDRTGFSRYNHYFECSVELGDTRYFRSLYRDWQILRVPLHDTALFRSTGRPRWEDVRLIRVWFDGMTAPDTLDFYSIEFSGSRWAGIRVTTLTGRPVVPPKRDTSSPFRSHNAAADTVDRIWVTGISRKTDTAYTAPFELKRDAQGRLEDEASLLVGYQNLRPDRRAVVTRTMADREDYRDYADARLYVHDDGNSLGMLFRAGSDSLNYYEYHSRVTAGSRVPGRDGRWFEFTIPLDSLPVLKLYKVARDSHHTATDTFSYGQYRMRGNPTLADIRYTALGIENDGPDTRSGAIWFDDLRLSSPRREPGTGAQARATLTLSDLLTASANVNYSDPNFRRFSDGREVRTGGRGTSVNASIRANVDRLLPAAWGISIPFLYQTALTDNVPKYSTDYTDLRLAGTPSANERSSGRVRDIGLDNVRKQRSGSRVLNYTVEALTGSWRQHQGGNQGPLGCDTSSTATTQLGYSIAPDWRVGVWRDEELSLLPNNVRLSATHNRRRDVRRSVRPRPESTITRSEAVSTDLGADYSPLDDLDFDYNLQTDRDLLPDSSRAWYRRLGIEASQDQSFSASYSIEIADLFTPQLDYDGNYSHDRLRSGLDYLNSRNMANSGDVDVSVGFDLPELLTRLGAEPRTRRAPPPPAQPGDSSSVPAGPRPDPGASLRRSVNGLSRHLEPIEFTWTLGRNSELVAVEDQPPWTYRLGFSDVFTFNPDSPPTSVTRDRDNGLRASTGGRVGELTARLAFDASEGRTHRLVSRTLNAVLDSTIVWPDITVNLGKVHNLFRQFATESHLSSHFMLRHVLSGELHTDSVRGEYLATYGRNDTRTRDFSPLLSWQTTWKRRVTTTLSASYSMATAFSYRNEEGTNRGESDSRTSGGELSLAYTFAAPQGIRLPFLKKVRFSSDLSLTWSLRYSRSARRERLVTAGDPAPEWRALQNDNSFSTTLSASYRFSRSIEAGLQTGYSRSKGLALTTTETMDLDVWVMFRF